MKTEIITTDGDSQEVQPANGRKFSLRESQAVVEGYIEIINLPDGRLMILNEDGNALGLPSNPVATVMAHNALTEANGIVGDVLVCDPTLID